MKILVVGLTAAGAVSLPAVLLDRIHAADMLCGGRRQLAYFPGFAGETHPITADVAALAETLQNALNRGRRAVVLASGDPLCYGIGASLRRYLPAEALEVVPAPTAFQLAFAALSEPWQDALLLSAHARPLADVVRQTVTATKAAILTDTQHSPAVIAAALIQAGLPGDTACAICENLGGPKQRVHRSDLANVANIEHAPLNVFVVWPQRGEVRAIAPGLPDEAFSTEGRQLTKREVRLLSLAELALHPGEILWDIGAGSGSVSIEAARSQPAAQVYAIEKRADLITHIQENLRRFPAPNVSLTHGLAPDDIAGWPDPQAVFIGGSGGRLRDIIEVVQQRLHVGGRLVLNLVTLDNLQTVHQQLPGTRIIQVQINRAVSILETQRLDALNPIFIVIWQKL